jgi:hypothetical protein
LVKNFDNWIILTFLALKIYFYRFLLEVGLQPQ